MSEQIHKLALGTVQFGLSYGIGNTAGQTSAEEVLAILDLARTRGINLLDTAFLYGNSESVLGDCGVEDFRVVSKFPDLEKAAELEAMLQQSLDRLKQPSLYAYMAHRSETLLANPEIWIRLQELKALGRIRKAGYSLYTVDELNRLLDRDMIPDILQVPFNVLDRRFSESLKDLHDRGTEVHTRSAFLQGLFFQPVQELPPFFDDLKPWLSQLNQLFPDPGNKAAALLNFCLGQSFIDRVVIGVNNREQLKKNLDTLENANHSASLPSIPEVQEALLLPGNWPKQES